MNYQSIKTFAAIAEQRSISGAARVLHFSQQVVSEQLKQLEKNLGVQLLFREKGARQIVLTPAGIAFLPLAQRWLEFQDQFEKQVDQFVRTQTHKSFRLAASSSAHQYIVSHIIHRLMQVFPETEMRLSTVEIADIPAAIEAGSFDAAFVFGEAPDHPAIHTVPFFSEERYILCPADTDLPDRMISAEELDLRYEVIYTTTSSRNYLDWRAQCFAEDVEPFFKVSSQMSVHHYLTDSRCWTIAPASITVQLMAQNPGKLTYRRITPSPNPRTCRLLLAKSYPGTDVVQELLRCCEAYIEERPYLQNIIPK